MFVLLYREVTSYDMMPVYYNSVSHGEAYNITCGVRYSGPYRIPNGVTYSSPLGCREAGGRSTSECRTVPRNARPRGERPVPSSELQFNAFTSYPPDARQIQAHHRFPPCSRYCGPIVKPGRPYKLYSLELHSLRGIVPCRFHVFVLSSSESTEAPTPTDYPAGGPTDNNLQR